MKEDYKIDDISESQLNLSYWLLMRRTKLKKYLRIFVIVLVAAIWLVFAYNLVLYIVYYSQTDQISAELAKQSVDFKSFNLKNRPQPLQVAPPQIIYEGHNRYDFVAQAINPNLNRGVKLQFIYSLGDYIASTGTMVILPGQKFYLTSLANQGPQTWQGQTPVLKITDISWFKVAPNTATIDKIIQVQDLAYQLSFDASHFDLSFNALNLTLENYWEITFQAALFSGPNLVGFNQITVDQLLAQANRKVYLNWYEKMPLINNVEIIPLVDVFDPDNRFILPAQANE